MDEQKEQPIVVGIAETVEDREEIYKLRYQIYHQEMGKQIKADQERQMIYDEYDENGYLFYAKINSQVVGTIRLHIGTAADFPSSIHDYFLLSQFQTYSPGRPILSYSSRLMVAPRYRSSQVLNVLLAELYRFGLEREIPFNFCYCAPQLVGLYEQIGYRRYTKNVSHPDTGFNVPIVLIADDVNYMRKVRSPFYRLAKRLGRLHNHQIEEWFQNQFPNAKQHITQRALNDSEFWAIIDEKLSASFRNQHTVLEGLDEDELKLLFRQATVLNCEENDLIVKDGNVGNEMFIVLSGAVEVTKFQNDRTHTIAMLGEGEVFGEMAFVSKAKRTATVSAITKSEIMVLTHDFFTKFIANHPVIASKVLLNLAVILCDRLGKSTQSWIDSMTK